MSNGDDNGGTLRTLSPSYGRGNSVPAPSSREQMPPPPPRQSSLPSSSSSLFQRQDTARAANHHGRQHNRAAGNFRSLDSEGDGTSLDYSLASANVTNLAEISRVSTDTEALLANWRRERSRHDAGGDADDGDADDGGANGSADRDDSLLVTFRGPDATSEGGEDKGSPERSAGRNTRAERPRGNRRKFDGPSAAVVGESSVGSGPRNGQMTNGHSNNFTAASSNNSSTRLSAYQEFSVERNEDAHGRNGGAAAGDASSRGYDRTNGRSNSNGGEGRSDPSAPSAARRAAPARADHKQRPANEGHGRPSDIHTSRHFPFDADESVISHSSGSASGSASGSTFGGSLLGGVRSLRPADPKRGTSGGAGGGLGGRRGGGRDRGASTKQSSAANAVPSLITPLSGSFEASRPGRPDNPHSSNFSASSSSSRATARGGTSPDSFS